MFVVNKDDNRKYEVYDITYDKTGYPHFLVYKDNQWLRLSAKHFVPNNYKPKLTSEQIKKICEFQQKYVFDKNFKYDVWL